MSGNEIEKAHSVTSSSPYESGLGPFDTPEVFQGQARPTNGTDPRDLIDVEAQPIFGLLGADPDRFKNDELLALRFGPNSRYIVDFLTHLATLDEAGRQTVKIKALTTTPPASAKLASLKVADDSEKVLYHAECIVALRRITDSWCPTTADHVRNAVLALCDLAVTAIIADDSIPHRVFEDLTATWGNTPGLASFNHCALTEQYNVAFNTLNRLRTVEPVPTTTSVEIARVLLGVLRHLRLRAPSVSEFDDGVNLEWQLGTSPTYLGIEAGGVIDVVSSDISTVTNRFREFADLSEALVFIRRDLAYTLDTTIPPSVTTSAVAPQN